MYSDEEDDISRPEEHPIYNKGKEILDMVIKIGDLIPENEKYLMDLKACMLSDAAELYYLKMENAARISVSVLASCIAIVVIGR